MVVDAPEGCGAGTTSSCVAFPELPTTDCESTVYFASLLCILALSGAVREWICCAVVVHFQLLAVNDGVRGALFRLAAPGTLILCRRLRANFRSVFFSLDGSWKGCDCLLLQGFALCCKGLECE